MPPESIQNVRPSTVLDSKVQEGVLKARRKKKNTQGKLSVREKVSC